MQTLLIIDDDEPSRILLKELLRDHNVKILEAADGKEAQLIFEAYTSEIVLVLLDIQLPDICGFELITNFRKIKHDISVIAISANPPESTKEECKNLGFDNLLSKPFSFGDFTDMINKFI